MRSVVALGALVASLALGTFACAESHITPRERLEHTEVMLPSEAQDNANGSIGPFCCTGRTATIRHEQGYPVGYIHYAFWRGQAASDGVGTFLPNLEIGVAALDNVADQASQMHEGAVLIMPEADVEQRHYEVVVGQLMFTFKVLNAMLSPEGGTPEAFHVTDQSPLVQATVRVLAEGEEPVLSEPLAYGTHTVSDGTSLRFSDLTLDVSFAASGQRVQLASEGKPLASADPGEATYATLAELDAKAQAERGVVMSVRERGEDDALLFIYEYKPTVVHLDSGYQGSVNLDIGDFLDLPAGVFQLTSTSESGRVAGQYIAAPGAEPQRIEGQRGQVFELPGIDASDFSPLDVNEGTIHFDVLSQPTRK